MDRVWGRKIINIETPVGRKLLRMKMKRVADKWFIRRETNKGVSYRVRRTIQGNRPAQHEA